MEQKCFGSAQPDLTRFSMFRECWVRLEPILSVTRFLPLPSWLLLRSIWWSSSIFWGLWICSDIWRDSEFCSVCICPGHSCYPLGSPKYNSQVLHEKILCKITISLLTLLWSSIIRVFIFPKEWCGSGEMGSYGKKCKEDFGADTYRSAPFFKLWCTIF